MFNSANIEMHEWEAPYQHYPLGPPHTRTVLLSVVTAQAKLCQVCSVWPARGFTTHAQLKLKEIGQFSL